MSIAGVVFLFDIDGTLLDSGGAGRRAMVGAFERLHGRPDACSSFSFGGMTDPAIIRRGLQAIDRPDADADVAAVLAGYLELLADEAPRSAQARVLPGVHQALDLALSLPRAAVGLGTGNVEAGAHIKLTRVGLRERFSFGGFGCDAEDRAELLRAGLARGARALGLEPARCRAVIIGDTPRDIEAAQAIGAAVLAVATGPFAADTLRQHRPDLVVDDLTRPEALAFLRDAAPSAG